ncbi:hypothetical protein [Agromyces seonyuensis]|uniref:Uncharacterized protein n=1 Tax=Agromyces seonyuensis TaxID=2662446 RepID=A0A6I4P620_9MICO|nr:hypothetical protein [Agromyces seonyuensis]MWB99959.1 hypothetical protein [Agromyces seonyuensis]
MITLTWLLLIAIAGGVLALVDGILRLRGRGTAIGIVEVIVSALFLLSLFVPGIPFGSLVLAVVTGIVLIVSLVARRGSTALAIAGLALLAIWIVLAQGWLRIPGIN